jgi:hypothetical protein
LLNPRLRDHIGKDAQQTALARVGAPVAKFFYCSRTPAIAYEARQRHGGNGHPTKPDGTHLPRSLLNSVCMDEVPFSDGRNRRSRFAFEAT